MGAASLATVAAFLDQLLQVERYRADDPIGLVASGRERVRRLAAAAAVSRPAIEEAQAARVELLLVQHAPRGDEDPLREEKLARLAEAGIGLYSAGPALCFAEGQGCADAVAARLGLAAEARFGVHPDSGARAGLVGAVGEPLDRFVARVRRALATPVQVVQRGEWLGRLALLPCGGPPGWLAEARALGCAAALLPPDRAARRYAAEVGLTLLEISPEAGEEPALYDLGRRVAERFGLRFRFLPTAGAVGVG